MKTEDIKKMAQAWLSVQEASKKKMDPVDDKELKGTHAQRKDKDINNDGKVDSTDKYLHTRRKTVAAAIKGKKKDQEVEVQTSEGKINENKNLIKDYGNMKAQGKKDNAILDVLMSMPKYKRMSKDQMAKVIGDAKRKGVFKEEVKQVDEISKKTLGSYINKASQDAASNAAKFGAGQKDKKGGNAFVKSHQRLRGIAKATDKLTKEAKDHGNMDNGSPMGQGLSPSAKKELARKTPAPSDAFDATLVNKKSFDSMIASAKKAPMRPNDNAQGDKTPPKAK